MLRVEVLLGRDINTWSYFGYGLIFNIGTLFVGSALLKFLHTKLEPDQQPEALKDHGSGYAAWGALLAISLQVVILLVVLDARSESLLDALAPLASLPWWYFFLIAREGSDKPRRRREIRIKVTESVRERIGRISPQPI